MCVLLIARASAAESAALQGPAIPPGEEQLLAAMLGRGDVIAGCVLSGAGVEYTVVKAAYACEDGNVVLQLSHPSTAPRTAIQTNAFAITLLSGSPPGSLLDALVSLIRAGESAFEWKWFDEDEDTTDDDAGAG